VVVAGNSLGCVSALYLAANEPVQGLFLKNPPALREIIRGQNGWWHPKLVKTILARQVPEVLDSIENAAAAKAPAVFVTARKDEVVPAPIQKLIIDAYGGSKQVLELPAARHATPLTAEELERLRELVQWLYAELGGSPSADG
jgi:pimeloyl-ACP methyl ester carboxylesterase